MLVTSSMIKSSIPTATATAREKNQPDDQNPNGSAWTTKSAFKIILANETGMFKRWDLHVIKSCVIFKGGVATDIAFNIFASTVMRINKKQRQWCSKKSGPSNKHDENQLDVEKGGLSY